MNVLSLFAGIGGLELGLERAGMTTVGQVELDPFCRQVLAKHWPEVPRHDDVRTAVEWWEAEPRPTVDVVCGGFPCQDISNAGRRAGIGGERSGLWTHMARTVRVLRPRYVVMENVSALLVRGLDVVAGDLAEIGYDLQWDCVPAAAVGAPHQRDRWWGVAYPSRDRLDSTGRRPDGFQGHAGLRGLSPQALPDAPVLRLEGGGEPYRDDAAQGAGGDGQPRRVRHGDGPTQLADATGGRRHERRHGHGPQTPSEWIFVQQQTRRGRRPFHNNWWASEPRMGRVVDGISPRVAQPRLRAFGNAVVPQVAEHVGRLVMEFDADRRAAA